MSRGALLAVVVVALGLGLASPARAQEPRVVEVEYVPVRRAQLAIWVERADGTYLRTLGLTQSVATRGVGNRPGASQMNGGFRWPYGRREGVLPVWAHRRASAPGAEAFRRVIFQDRGSEGYASRTSNDYSRDEYYCLSFNQTASSRDALDAVTCPSVFNSDKGRYLTEGDLEAGYAEPFQRDVDRGEMRALSLDSLYPPRRDLTRCDNNGCYDHIDVASFAADARRAMPEIDAVSMATPPEGVPQRLSFSVPDDWESGEYVLFVEVNTEGDYNETWGPARFPTPVDPDGEWDYWAENYGYPFRGQPSVVFRVPFTLDGGAVVTSAVEPAGYGAIDGLEDEVRAMDGTITDAPELAPGSGADRLFLTGGEYRVRLTVVGPEVCESNEAPSAIAGLALTEYRERNQAHRYAHLRFLAASDDLGVSRYEVRLSAHPIVDDESFMRAMPAQAATLDSEALVIPVDVAPGMPLEVDLGGLGPETRYHVAVRAFDRCNVAGPLAAVEYATPAIEFTTVSPCFVATAAYGSPMARELGPLRRFRDRHLRTNAVGRALVTVYEEVGPSLADAIREDEDRRAIARALLSPIVALLR